eukprot:scaffold8150_cov69-Cyclotella_meneghiniana.AAC.8
MIIKPALLHFKFDGFVDLPSEVDDMVDSDVQTDYNGNKWELNLFPGGVYDDAGEPGWISLSLHYKGKKTLDVACRLAVKNVNGEIIQKEDYDYTYLPGFYDDCGNYQFMLRDQILDPNNNILKDGALYIDVTIQVKDKQEEHYNPESKLSTNMLKLLESGDGADASFKVGDQTFSVHSNILRSNAPILASHLHKSEAESAVIIEGLSAVVFKLVLDFVYSEQRPSKQEMLEHGKNLIDSANRYELVDLKMTVEHLLVREHAQSCALLKEYAITFLRLNAKEVLGSDYSKCLKESCELLTEVLILFANSDNDEDTTVNELRKELGKMKLDVDGSKDALVKRLEEAKSQTKIV